ncbi:menG [Symbiodinium natans]|uniref:MenG protein n=1 Tax=Symbiodinium natans TaxID=878477 RepID=A0A812JE94_9DINO|nr:menG [Symbiodinium natans]
MASAAEWDGAAGSYHSFARFTEQFARHAVATALGPLSTRTGTEEQPLMLLDVASGTGVAAFGLIDALPANAWATVLATDFAEAMLGQLRAKASQRAEDDAAKHPHVTLQAERMDAQDMPSVRDATMDAATMVFGLHNLPNPVSGAREFYRVLRPGAKGVIVTWHWNKLREFIAQMRLEVGDVEAKAADYIGPMTNEGEMRRCLHEAGIPDACIVVDMVKGLPMQMSLEELVVYLRTNSLVPALREVDASLVRRVVSEDRGFGAWGDDSGFILWGTAMEVSVTKP